MSIASSEITGLHEVALSEQASRFLYNSGVEIAPDTPHVEACEAAYLNAEEGAALVATDLASIKEGASYVYTVSTPDYMGDGLRPETIANIARVKALSFALALGHLGTSQYEEGGAKLSLVTPTPGWENTQSYRGGETPLLFHQEMLPKEGLTTRESLTKFVILSCVSDTTPATPTAASSIRRSLALLSETDLEALRQPAFKLRPYDAMELEHAGAVEEKPEPIIHPDGLVVADFADIEAYTEEGLQAFENFRKAAEQVAVNVTLKPGETLVVDNRKSFHGRGVIPPGHGKRMLIRAHAVDENWANS